MPPDMQSRGKEPTVEEVRGGDPRYHAEGGGDLSHMINIGDRETIFRPPPLSLGSTLGTRFGSFKTSNDPHFVPRTSLGFAMGRAQGVRSPPDSTSPDGGLEDTGGLRASLAERLEAALSGPNRSKDKRMEQALSGPPGFGAGGVGRAGSQGGVMFRRTMTPQSDRRNVSRSGVTSVDLGHGQLRMQLQRELPRSQTPIHDGGVQVGDLGKRRMAVANMHGSFAAAPLRGGPGLF